MLATGVLVICVCACVTVYLIVKFVECVSDCLVAQRGEETGIAAVFQDVDIAQSVMFCYLKGVRRRLSSTKPFNEFLTIVNKTCFIHSPDRRRKALATYPIFLLYVSIGWFGLVKTSSGS